MGTEATLHVLPGLDALVADAAALPLASMDQYELLMLGDRLGLVVEQLSAVYSMVLRQADLTGVDKDAVVDHLYLGGRISRAEARRQLRLARELDLRFPILKEAWLAGDLSQDQLRAILKGLRGSPLPLGEAEWAEAQAELVAHATQFGPEGLEAIAGKHLETRDPERFEAEAARRAEMDARNAFERRTLRLAPDGHGSMTIRGSVPILVGEHFAAQLASLMPSLESYRDTATTVTDTIPSPGARMADALAAFTNRLAATTDLPELGGDRPVVIITIPLKTLLEGTGVAVTAAGETVAASEARRLAADAHLIPVVLGGDSQPLDVGRRTRYFRNTLRKALVLRDQGCAFPGCEAPVAICEGHHITPWEHGGQTSLSNAVLLCPFHHRAVEPDPGLGTDAKWQVTLDPTTGMPWFTPPATRFWDRHPRQHHRYRLRHGPPGKPVKAPGGTSMAADPPMIDPPASPHPTSPPSAVTWRPPPATFDEFDDTLDASDPDVTLDAWGQPTRVRRPD